MSISSLIEIIFLSSITLSVINLSSGGKSIILLEDGGGFKSKENDLPTEIDHHKLYDEKEFTLENEEAGILFGKEEQSQLAQMPKKSKCPLDNEENETETENENHNHLVRPFMTNTHGHHDEYKFTKSLLLKLKELLEGLELSTNIDQVDNSKHRLFDEKQHLSYDIVGENQSQFNDNKEPFEHNMKAKWKNSQVRTNFDKAKKSTLGGQSRMSSKLGEKISPKNTNLGGGQVMSELDQQEDSKYVSPIKMYMMEDELRLLDMIKGTEEATSFKSIHDSNNEPIDLLKPFASAERARNSLLKAADIARYLSSTTTTTTTTMKPMENKFPNSDWSIDMSQEDGANHNLNMARPTFEQDDRRLVTKFLGFGQLQRIDGNDRLQVRLNCQFGPNQLEEGAAEEDNNNNNNGNSNRNVTISNVEWNKFENYNNTTFFEHQQQAPPFDCQNENCSIKPVKTDVLTTVHPRPAIQNYINTKVPSYSVTLHEVNESHLGTYRCSAIRQLENGSKELVYRIIVLD